MLAQPRTGSLANSRPSRSTCAAPRMRSPMAPRTCRGRSDADAVVRNGLTALRDLSRLLETANIEGRKEFIRAFVGGITVRPDVEVLDLQMNRFPAHGSGNLTWEKVARASYVTLLIEMRPLSRYLADFQRVASGLGGGNRISAESGASLSTPLESHSLGGLLETRGNHAVRSFTFTIAGLPIGAPPRSPNHRPDILLPSSVLPRRQRRIKKGRIAPPNHRSRSGEISVRTRVGHALSRATLRTAPPWQRLDRELRPATHEMVDERADAESSE
jgi:hypothetical protein